MIRHFVETISQYSYFIVYAARASLRTEVANSFLNRLWWILDPFLNMLVYTFVFGTIFGIKEENYSVFIFSGLLVWNFFSRTMNSSVKIVRKNKNIISKVYIPKYVLLIEEMLVNLYKMLFSMLVLLVMMLISNVSVTFRIFYMIPVMMELFLCTFAFGIVLLHFGVFIDDLSYAIGILLKLLLYLSGVMYHIDTRLDADLALMLKICNPMAMLIDAMHQSLLYGQRPDLGMMGLWAILLFGISVLGIRIIYKYENSFVKVI